MDRDYDGDLTAGRELARVKIRELRTALVFRR